MLRDPSYVKSAKLMTPAMTTNRSAGDPSAAPHRRAAARARNP